MAALLADAECDDLALRQGVPFAVGAAQAEPLVQDDDRLFVDHVPVVGVGRLARRAGYVRNIDANPRVRIKLRGGWRSGTARRLPHDDALERLRTMGLRPNATAVRTMGTDLLTVRIDLDPEEA